MLLEENRKIKYVLLGVALSYVRWIYFGPYHFALLIQDLSWIHDKAMNRKWNVRCSFRSQESCEF